MSGTAGIFSSKISLYTYFDNAEGLKVGAPVRLQGVDVGNVKAIRVVKERKNSPVQVLMRVNTKYQELVQKDTKATVATAGVLGEAFIDLDSRLATGPTVQNNDELPATNTPGLEDVVRSSQGTLQNLDTLVKRMDRIVATIESGKGPLGEFINNPTFFNRANAILAQVQTMVNDVGNGKGTSGKFFADDTLYKKFAADVDKLDRMIDDIQQGKGSAGKFLKDDSLYNNANQTIAKANKLMDEIHAGHGTLGMLAKDDKFAKKLDATIDQLASVLQKLESGNGTAGRIIKDPSLYNHPHHKLVDTTRPLKT